MRTTLKLILVIRRDREKILRLNSKNKYLVNTTVSIFLESGHWVWLHQREILISSVFWLIALNLLRSMNHSNLTLFVLLNVVRNQWQPSNSTTIWSSFVECLLPYSLKEKIFLKAGIFLPMNYLSHRIKRSLQSLN